MAFWRAAYEEHAPAVLSYVLRRLGRRDEAEDLLQETFVRAIRADSFGIEGNLRGYLLRTAHNLWVNRLRRPRLVVPGPAALEDEEEAPDPLARTPEASPSPEDTALWAGFRRELRRVLGAMPEAHRRAFELGVLQGLPYAEVVRRTGWTMAQVKINVFRARRRILDELGDQIPFLERSTEP